jgi:hypothetical protein
VSLVESPGEPDAREAHSGGKPWFFHSSDWLEEVFSIERMSMLEVEGSVLSFVTVTGLWEDSLKVLSGCEQRSAGKWSWFLVEERSKFFSERDA